MLHVQRSCTCVFVTRQLKLYRMVQATWALEQAQALGNSKIPAIRYDGSCSFHHAFVMSLRLLRTCHWSTTKLILQMILVQPCHTLWHLPLCAHATACHHSGLP
jgi:hypothetical protein